MTSDSRLEDAEKIRTLEQSVRRLEKLAYDFAEAMMRIADTRDPHVRRHELDVAHMARAIAQDMGLPASDIEDVSMAGLLCDIGKLGVPEEVLANPGKLSDSEYEQMKSHVTHGARILSTIEFPGPVAEIVSQHHERLDGSGYPLGAEGDDIVLGARILAVADVVEAMRSERPYRPAIATDEVIEEIQSHPERYDAAVVAACLRVLGRSGS